MPHRFDATRSLTILEQDSTIIAVIEMSNRSGSFRRSFPALNASPLRSLTPTKRRCGSSCIVGATKLARPGVRSTASLSLTRRDAMASG
jgi:hypothetical protein